jgi:hypothetical protein
VRANVRESLLLVQRPDADKSAAGREPRQLRQSGRVIPGVTASAGDLVEGRVSVEKIAKSEGKVKRHIWQLAPLAILYGILWLM